MYIYISYIDVLSINQSLIALMKQLLNWAIDVTGGGGPEAPHTPLYVYVQLILTKPIIYYSLTLSLSLSIIFILISVISPHFVPLKFVQKATLYCHFWDVGVPFLLMFMWTQGIVN